MDYESDKAFCAGTILYNNASDSDSSDTLVTDFGTSGYTTIKDDTRSNISIMKFVFTYIYPYGEYVTNCLAVLSGILVLVTMRRSWNSWKYSSGILLVTLASVDIINNVMNIFILTVVSNPVLFCKMETIHDIIMYLQTVLLHISNYMMVLISLNRYALVCKPFAHSHVTSRKSTLSQIAAVGTILLVLNIYNFFSKTVDLYNIGYLVVYVLLSHIVPVLISAVLTILVILEFTKKASNHKESVNTVPRQGGRNVTKAMIVVNVAFILLTIPQAVSHTLHLVFNWKHEHVSKEILVAVIVLTCVRDINFSINLFIYTAYIPRFRVTLLEIVKCKFKGGIEGKYKQQELNIQAPTAGNSETHSFDEATNV